MTQEGLNEEMQNYFRCQGFRTAINTITFDGGAGSGAVGTVALFTVTGEVKMKILAVCTVNGAGAGATVEVGTAKDINAFIAQTTLTDVDVGEIWHDASPDNDVEASTILTENIVAAGADIIITVGTADATGGAIRFICLWTPLSQDGKVVSA